MGKRKKAKLTPMQRAYEKERKRIRRYLRRYEKLGYEITIEVPDRPARVTRKQLRLIKEITPKAIQSKIRWVDVTTGEIMTGLERQKLNRQLGYKKGRGITTKKPEDEVWDPSRWLGGPSTPRSDKGMSEEDYADMIIGHFMEAIDKLPPKVGGYVRDVVQSAIVSAGSIAVADGIEKSDERFHDLLHRMEYDSQGAASEYSSILLNYIPGLTEGLRDELEMDFYRYEYDTGDYEY